MPSPNATPTPITPPRVPLVNPTTGLIDRAWYMFFISLFNAATNVDNSNVGPSAESLIASYDAALRALADEVGTQPAPVDLTAELVKQLEAAGIVDQSSSLISQVAEIQKQLDALNSAPPPSLGTVTAVTATSPVASSGGIAPDISLNAAYGDTQNPYAIKTANYVLAGPTTGAAALPTFRALVAADIPTLGYVTAVSVASANGFAGTSSGGATPALTLTTSITGLIYGNGTAIAATTISTPLSYSAGTLSLTSGYGDTQNPYTSKTANYVLAAPNGSAGVPTFRALVAADIPALPYGTGTVTSVSVTSANGFAGTVATATTTPAITISTSITGLLYGNGTAIAASTISAPLSYSAGTLSITQSGTSTNGYLSSTDWNTFNNKQPAGTYVTSVTGTAPVVSSGGTTPAISMAAANTSTNGYLTSTDWNTFNNKQTTSAPVTYTANFSVAATDAWIINNKSGSSCTATLPAASSYSGRVLHFQNYQAQILVSASSNVVPLAGGAAGTSILLASAGDSATLVSDGSNWLVTQYVPNNILLLE